MAVGEKALVLEFKNRGQFILTRAGVGELLLTHIPPWTSREDVISEAKAEFDGPVHAVVCGETFDVTRH